jgi:hypothetical protein
LTVLVVVTADGAFVDHVAPGGGERDVTAGDDAAGLVDQVVAGLELC